MILVERDNLVHSCSKLSQTDQVTQELVEF